MTMYSSIREKNKRIRRINHVKADLDFLKKDEILKDEIYKEIDAVRDGVIDLNSGLSNTDPVQGGGTSQEDKYFIVFDEIAELERDLKLIELDNRALKKAISELSNEEILMVKHLWIDKDESLRSMGEKLNLSKSTVQRKSDKALLQIFHKLYVLTPKEVHPN